MSKPVQSLLFVFFMIWGATATAATPAPDFEMPTRDGNVSLAGLKGRVVYLDFWATWCPPCRKSFPWMKEIQARYEKDGLTIVAVNMDQARDPVDEYLQEMQPNFTIAFNPKGDVAEAYHVKAMPSSYIIDRDGKLRAVHLGFRSGDKDALEAEIKAVLAE